MSKEKTPTHPASGDGKKPAACTTETCPLNTTPYGKKINHIPSRAQISAFRKDSQGKIIATPIGKPYVTSHGGFIDQETGEYSALFMFQKYELELIDGTTISAFKSLGRYDKKSKEIIQDNRMDTDCHGVTFTNGEYWINNDEVDKILDKGGYKSTRQPKVGDILVYRKNGSVVHSVTVTEVDKNGKVVTVSGLGGIEPEEHSDTPDTGWSDPKASKEYYRSPSGHLNMIPLKEINKLGT